MAMGRRKESRQEALFVTAEQLPRSQGHPFYKALNRLLADAGFDRWIEERCLAFYQEVDRRGQRSLPPGVYFRMLLVGYFEGIGSQRGIAWRCADSLSLREFLGIPLDQGSPDHSTLSNTRRRLPPEVFQEVFEFVLKIAADKKLLSGKTVGVDSTTLEADAAMKSIVRRDTGEDWQAYVVRLMREDGVITEDEDPSDDEIRRFDRRRKDKKVSNEEWVSPTDPSAKIARMKDGTTHLSYKAEHVVDLHSDLILAAEITPATHGDTQTLVDSVLKAEAHLQAIGCQQSIEEVVADKGYHAVDTLELCEAMGLRTYIPEPKRRSTWSWTDKTPDHERALRLNRQRMSRTKGKQLQKRRSELCERTFAHVCETGGLRRSWLKGLIDVTKRYVMAAAAHNLGRLLRKLTGVGKPRSLQGAGLWAALGSLLSALSSLWPWLVTMDRQIGGWEGETRPTVAAGAGGLVSGLWSTGC